MDFNDSKICDIEQKIFNAVISGDHDFLRSNLKKCPVYIINLCVKYDKTIIFDDNEDHHFYIVMAGLINEKLDIIRSHLPFIKDPDYLSTINLFMNPK